MRETYQKAGVRRWRVDNDSASDIEKLAQSVDGVGCLVDTEIGATLNVVVAQSIRAHSLTPFMSTNVRLAPKNLLTAGAILIPALLGPKANS